jgi:hypothetical protein
MRCLHHTALETALEYSPWSGSLRNDRFEKDTLAHGDPWTGTATLRTIDNRAILSRPRKSAVACRSSNSLFLRRWQLSFSG